MRKRLGLLLFACGGLLLAFAIARYVIGMVRADEARSAWNDAEARATVALARSMAAPNPDLVLDIGAPVARIVIPRIDLDEIVLEGVDADELNAGPGHLPGSVLPGERGNSVISAHRDRHFSHLDALSVGDTIRTESGRYATTWLVVSTRVLDKDAPALFNTREPTLTLTTCWPIRYLGSAPDRLIVTARPVGFRALPRAGASPSSRAASASAASAS